MTEDLPGLQRVQDTVERFVRGRPAVAADDRRDAAHDDLDREDVVQEAMARLLENRTRLDPSAWEAYAVVSARNLLRDRERAGQVERRHRHRLHAPDVRAGVEEQVLTREEHAALRRALTDLPPEDRSLLDDRYGQDDVDPRSVAPAAAARLARARAKLRVAYLLQHTGLALPTERCRPVLEALSSGDRRRQERLGTGRHLVACRVCATYAPVLAGRQRALAALHPLAWTGGALGGVWVALRRQPARTTAVAVSAGVALGGAAVLTAQDPGPGPQRTPAAAAADPTPSTPPGSLTVVPGRPVGAVQVPVQSVPADEGFWVGRGPGARTWVQLSGPGESAQQVRPGDRVSFDGRSVALSPGQPEQLGLTVAEGADELRELGAYVAVPRAAMVVSDR